MFKVIDNDWIFLLSDDTPRWSGNNLNSEEMHIYEETGQFDHHTFDFCFKSWLCNNETDPQSVWQIAYDLIGLLNGALLLYAPVMYPQSIESILQNDTPIDRYADLSLPYYVYEEAQEMLPEIKDRLPVPNTAAFRLVQESLKNDGLYILVRLLGLAPSWVTLYQVYETVKHLSPRSIKDRDIISASEDEKFRFTANNFSASGLESRHGMVGQKPRDHTKFIPLGEAKNIVRRICHDCIGTIAGEPFASMDLPLIPGTLDDLRTIDFTGEWFPD